VNLNKKEKIMSQLFAPKKNAVKKSTLDVSKANEVAEEIDSYVKLAAEIKSLEAQQAIVKAKIMDYAEDEFAKNLSKGDHANFKLAGDKDSVTFIAQNSGSQITEEDLVKAKHESGEIVDELVHVDYGSIRINGDVFEKHADKISALLIKGLGAEVASELFSAPAYGVKKDVLKQISEAGLKTDEVRTLVAGLKIKRYIRV
jgi:hypothetical protein